MNDTKKKTYKRFVSITLYVDRDNKKRLLLAVYNEPHGVKGRERDKMSGNEVDRARMKERKRERDRKNLMCIEKKLCWSGSFSFFLFDDSNRSMVFFLSHSTGKGTMSNDGDKIYFCAPLKMDVFWSHGESKVESVTMHHVCVCGVRKSAQLLHYYALLPHGMVPNPIRFCFNWIPPPKRTENQKSGLKSWGLKRKKHRHTDWFTRHVTFENVSGCNYKHHSVSAWLGSATPIKVKLDLNCECGTNRNESLQSLSLFRSLLFSSNTFKWSASKSAHRQKRIEKKRKGEKERKREKEWKKERERV